MHKYPEWRRKQREEVLEGEIGREELVAERRRGGGVGRSCGVKLLCELVLWLVGAPAAATPLGTRKEGQLWPQQALGWAGHEPVSK